jgi:hypothetical protein
MQQRIGSILLALTLLGMHGCAPSEDDVKHDFMKLVAASNACQSADDCTILSLGCPLGCGVAVNRKQAARVQQGGEDLIADYERYGRACAYECVAPAPVATCVALHCALDSSLPDAGTDAAH